MTQLHGIKATEDLNVGQHLANDNLFLDHYVGDDSAVNERDDTICPVENAIVMSDHQA